jgi:predicted ATPase
MARQNKKSAKHMEDVRKLANQRFRLLVEKYLKEELKKSNEIVSAESCAAFVK